MAKKTTKAEEVEQEIFNVVKEIIEGSDLFIGTNTGIEYITWMDRNEQVRTDAVKSQNFKYAIFMECVAIKDKFHENKLINKIVDYFLAHALASKNKKTIYSRIAKVGDEIVYNLNNEARQYVVVSAERPCLENEIEVSQKDCAFISNSLMGEQMIPKIKKEHNLYDLLSPFLNMDEDSKKLLTVCLVAWFIQDIPKAVILLQGEQGSGKTFLTSLIQKIVDPVTHETLNSLDTKEDLGVALATHYVMAVDNITDLPKGVSDLLCQASTGGSMLKRTKYSNFDASVVSFKNCVLLNGITIENARLDLRDRIVGFELPTLSKKYVSAKTLEKEFDEKLPYILGQIFYVLSQAMKIYDELEYVESPRLVDFFTWGRAIATVVFGTDQEFIEIFLRNKGFVFEELVQSDPLGNAMKIYLNSLTSFPCKVNSTELYKKLMDIARINHINMNSERWVTGSQELSNKLKTLVPAFRGMGYSIVIDSNNKSNGVRYIRIGKTETVTNEQIA